MLTDKKINVTRINFHGNMLDDTAMENLAAYIENNDCITHLDISMNNITDKGIEILSHSIIGHPTLKTLIIGFNGDITDASVPNILKMINESSITDLYVGEDFISEENLKKIDHALQMPLDGRSIPIKSSSKSAAKKA